MSDLKEEFKVWDSIEPPGISQFNDAVKYAAMHCETVILRGDNGSDYVLKSRSVGCSNA
jgi:hypothetical protein